MTSYAVQLLAALAGIVLYHAARGVIRHLRGRRHTATVAGPGGILTVTGSDPSTVLRVASAFNAGQARLVRDQVQNQHADSAPAGMGFPAQVADSPVGDDEPPASSPTAAQLQASATAFRHLVVRACDADRRRRFSGAPASRLTVDQAMVAADVADRFEQLAREAAHREALEYRAAQQDLRSAFDELHALAAWRMTATCPDPHRS